MSSRRLVRSGTVRHAEGGCTSVEVSVPCTACRSGCCPGAGRERLINLNEHRSRSLRLGNPGDRVEISVAAGGLSAICVRLFGPAIAVFAGVALSAVSGPAAVVAVALSLIPALLLGRRLAIGRLALLDVRVRPTDGKQCSDPY